MPLEKFRTQIDELDRQLLDLLAKRAELVHEIGLVKKREGLQIYAPEREKALLAKLEKINKGRIPKHSLQAIYREIMSASLYLEDDLKIAYLGPEGTWTHQAAIKKFGHSVNYLPQSSFADVFDLVARRKTHYGVVPIENSTEGAVSHTLDLFVDSPLRICAQILLRIDNALLSNVPREEIKTLYSHPQVFGQCKGWILQNFPHADLVETSSTTKAAQIAREQVEAGAAALGGVLAGELHDLQVLETSIQDRANNTTRFLVISEKTCPPTGEDRTSILFAIHDKPGALVKALQSFEAFQINMSKIESRPSKKQEWEYVFYVDLAGHCLDTPLAKALQELHKHCSLLKVLGSYPSTVEE